MCHFLINYYKKTSQTVQNNQCNKYRQMAASLYDQDVYLNSLFNTRDNTNIEKLPNN